MNDLAEYIEFVKEQIAFHQRQADRRSDNPSRSAMHSATAKKFSDLVEILESPALKQQGSPLGGQPQRLSLSWKEVEGLPDELMAELSVSESDREEGTILSIIEDAGGVASLDRIIISLYKKTGQISKRSLLNARLYRMVQREVIFSVPGKKGVYSIAPLSEEDAAGLK